MESTGARLSCDNLVSVILFSECFARHWSGFGIVGKLTLRSPELHPLVLGLGISIGQFCASQKTQAEDCLLLETLQQIANRL